MRKHFLYIDALAEIVGISDTEARPDLTNLILDMGCAFVRERYTNSPFAEAVIKQRGFWEWWLDRWHRLDESLYNDLDEAEIEIESVLADHSDLTEWYIFEHDPGRMLAMPPQSVISDASKLVRSQVVKTL